MLELKLPETGTVPYPYSSEDFHYELLLYLNSVRSSGCTGDRINFELSLKDPKYPRYPKDTMEYILPKCIFEEDGYRSIEKNGGLSTYEKDLKRSLFVEAHIMKTLADLIAESVRQESGRLLLSGRENISNSYYAHREIYVLPAISGVGIVDVRAGTCPGNFVRAFCSDEVDTARKERIKERVLSRFVKLS